MSRDSSCSDKEKSVKSRKSGNSPERKRKKYKDDKESSSSKKGRRDRSPDRKKRSKRERSYSRSLSKERTSSWGRREKRKYVDLDKPAEEIEYPRYYGNDDNSFKENNDQYWNKYPKKDDAIVGSRYYDGGQDKEENKSRTEAHARKEVDKQEITARQRKTVDLLTSKTGGAYIPPAKLRMMQAEITDKSSAAYQRIAWEALKKSIHGYINKVNTSNIGIIARELLHENIVRGRGLLSKSLIQAQAASPTFTHVYAALVAVINSKFPNIGELLLKRLVLQFKRGFKQNNKNTCITASSFIAHLVNQRVAHEILALEILTLLVESPTDDSVEVAISFLKECGQKLTEVSSKGINAIFEMLRNILHEGKLEKRIQYMIEVMFQIRKDGFKDHAAIIEELDLVEEEDQFTHLITLDDVETKNGEDVLNVFKFDEKYEENEGKYKTLSKEILDTDSSGSESGSEGSDEDEDEEEEEVKDQGLIIDNTETNLVTLRRTIYLTIQSSLDFEECAHKLMKMELKPGQEIELCHMFLDCCAEQRTYEKFYGLLAQRFCQINKIYVTPFEQIFRDTYATTHRLDTNRLRNVSKFFAHLLFTDAIGWEVLEAIKLNEEDTTSSSRIFIKILFQELAEYMGLGKLNARLKDETLQEHFAGLFPRDNPKNTRFAINFFTSIGLGGLTDGLREHLKAMPKNPTMNLVQQSSSSDSDESSNSSSASSSSDSSDSSTESSSDGESEKKKKQKEKNRVKGEKKKNTERNTSETKKKQRDSSDENRKKSSKKDPRKDAAQDKHQKDKDRHEVNVERLRKEREMYENTRTKRSKSRDRQKLKESSRNRDYKREDRMSSRDNRNRRR
ncbi:pre-mRNA-splicing factor CWC22 homolog [Agrilus planipennis]|uniref:Pre-mRNA-splicing factor CWC22 homolog n=1 Tax=Agrilus planipennis TaxID=224129 RepID=A0A1W4XLD9_AGRPL|nr:pre-mRNA-splicing factor CWC22 homolog [Agrilus planipennis]XP_018333283.1 pre-mRNA-splicing factor CWC22 homolog [Agrilus planipennis]